MLDALVVGSGPNGLAAAITLVRAGLDVRVLEANEAVGGGMRSAALTLPGFVHDPCSAVFPLGIASPFFRSLPRRETGIEWVHGAAPLVHIGARHQAVVVHASIDKTVAGLGSGARAYHKLMTPIVGSWPVLLDRLLGPPWRVPRHPVALGRFGLRGLRSSAAIAELFSGDERARALWAGVSAHLAAPLETRMSAAPALLLLAAAHSTGWPIARGGTGSLTAGMVRYLRSLGGEIETGRRVGSMRDLPRARATLFDTSPAQAADILGGRVPRRYRRQLERFRRGPALFKLDYALSGPVPWRDATARLAPTVHLGDSYESIARSERALGEGRMAGRPFIIVVQPTLFDDSRAPDARHTLWAYCHVPNGSRVDATEVIESRIEEAAPGFRELVLARTARGPEELERENANFAGGDFSNGAMSGLQMLFRPALRFDPYRIPVEGMFLCSAATPPGPGVHGMCGYWAARSALRSLGIAAPALTDATD